MEKISGEIYIIIIATAFLLLICFFFFGFILLYQRRHDRFNREKEKMDRDYAENLLQSKLEIQEQTMKHISEEIHDNIGQVLSLAKINLYSMDPAQATALEPRLLNTRELVSQAITDLRSLSHSLNTDFIQQKGLLGAIADELERIRKTAALETRLIVEGQPFRIESQNELILFRMVQESLNNCLKHAEASSLEVHAGFSDRTMRLIIRDNGKGMPSFSSDQGKEPSGMGLSTLLSRGRLIGVDTKIDSYPGAGTTITIVWNDQTVQS